ncbi:hypothetical protein A4A49_59881 [Nicotiana attenuata]|uniref:Uncharacterized protein n=1 Tax=Nicotiana attenuata TaxID=49451 RepID=A0A1J6IMC3_NICAT|nr:hypothetical protein A4A49_59881 [Nicotiana attenuata]
MGSSESSAKNLDKRKDGENVEQLTATNSSEEVIKGVALAAGVALVGWGLSKLIDGDSNERANNKKMMKAPGRDYYINRDDFERDPSGYFRNLRRD